MFWRAGFVAAGLAFAFAILFISIFRTAAVKYEFSSPTTTSSFETSADPVKYNLAFPGKILPDNILWPLKALRDRVWYLVTTNDTKQAELLLLFADKRLAAAEKLFDKGDFSTGYATMSKAEKYLELAYIKGRENYDAGINSTEFFKTIALASLKHYEVMGVLMESAPEDALPGMVQIRDYPKRIYELAVHVLNEEGVNYPISPFNWN